MSMNKLYRQKQTRERIQTTQFRSWVFDGSIYSYFRVRDHPL